MAGDIPVTLSLLLSLGGGVLAGVVTIGGVLWKARNWFDEKFGALRADMQIALSSQRTEANENMASLRADVKKIDERLRSHELHVSRTYAMNDRVDKGFERIATMIDADRRESRADMADIKQLLKDQRSTR